MSKSQHKQPYLLVEINVFGEVVKFSNWSGFLPGVVSIPTLALDGMTAFGGTLQEEKVSVVMPIAESKGILPALLAAGTVTRSFVRIRELTFGPDGSTLQSSKVIFTGEIQVASNNVRGKPRQGALRLVSIKNRTYVPLGLPCNGFCPFTVGDGACQVDLTRPEFNFELTMDSFDPDTFQAILLGAPSSVDGLFSRGTLSFNFGSLGIRYWSNSSPAVFFLNRPVPDSWIGQTVIATAGCDNTVEECETVFNNIENNGGIGRQMLDYDPNFEVGGLL